jgi:hypothetical protein
MNIQQMQTLLQLKGRYHGRLDGQYGPLTGAAVMLALTDGPDTQITDADYIAQASALDLPVPVIKAFALVESSGDGFTDGRPTILFEPHRFSRATKGVWDQSAPDVSYTPWDRNRYPKTQGARYTQLVKAVGLNVDAGFASASYGKFQVLGENFKLCGYENSFEFAVAQARNEAAQLDAFVAFIRRQGIDHALRQGDYETAADKYNGTASRKNDYAGRLRKAVVHLGGKV